MVATSEATAAEKQRIAKKLITLLKKRYKASVPKNDRPILDTILYAICLENSSLNEADEAFRTLETRFYDLNEIRVSSISELAEVFSGLDQPEWRAMRVRSVLHFVFEKNYEFTFESLRRKTLDLAGKQLAKIKELSPFVRKFTLQSALGSHLIPVDEVTCDAAVWLGFVVPDAKVNKASDSLKSAVRKADVPVFCYLLRRLATDPKVRKYFDSGKRNTPKEGFDLFSAPNRLDELFKTAESRARSASKKKKAKSARSTTKKKPAKRTSKTAARKKTTTKKKLTTKKGRGSKNTTTKRKTASRR